jgi:predicted RNase H-like nuclease (RuvC/YqgF family)
MKKTIKEKTDSVAMFKQKILKLENTNIKLQNKVLKLENKVLKAEQTILKLKAENTRLKSETHEERLKRLIGNNSFEEE